MGDSRLESGGTYLNSSAQPRFLKGVMEALSELFSRRPAWQPLAKDEEELSEANLDERSGASLLMINHLFFAANSPMF